MPGKTQAELEELLLEAQQALMLMQLKLDQLTGGPFHYATLITPPDGTPRIRVCGTGGIVELYPPLPESDTKALRDKIKKEEMKRDAIDTMLNKLRISRAKKLSVGQRFLVNNMGTIVEEINSDFVMPGTTSLIRRAIPNTNLFELEASTSGQQGGTQVVYNMLAEPPSPGDEVLCDSSRSCILHNLGRPIPTSTFRLESDVNVSWDDIGGLDSVRMFFDEVFFQPIQHPEIYSKYGCKPPAGALLAGPPGNGKTLIAKAVATHLAKLFGTSGSGFFSVKGPEILSQWVGAAEARIKDLFTQARLFSQTSASPSIIFIDEAESVMNRRGSGRSSDVDRTIVPAFLTEMDGLQATAGTVFVLLATNRPDLLDPAIVREGRIDQKVLIPRPTLDTAPHIFRVHLGHAALSQAVTLEELVRVGTESLFDNSHRLAEVRMADNSILYFTLSHIASGAMIASIVNSAAMIARRRDLRSHEFSGIGPGDLQSAVAEALTANRVLAHDDEVKEFYADKKDDVVEVVSLSAKGNEV